MSQKPTIPSFLSDFVETVSSKKGPLDVLYGNEYKGVHLQYPLNIDSAEEPSWVRFDISKINGTALSETSGNHIANVLLEKEGKLNRDDIKNTVQKLTTSALALPVTAAKSVADEFLSSLPPFFGKVGKSVIGPGRETKQTLGSITLYAPHTRQETYQIGWSDLKIEQTGDIMQGGFANRILAGLRSSGQAVAEDAAGMVVASAIGNDAVKAVNQRARAQATNHHLELFFEGIEFRTFTFEFKMAPRNPEEARQIQKIVKLFKWAAAPAESSQFYWEYPHIFNITMFNESETHKILPAALRSIQVDHSASGVNSTFYDKYPTETNLSLTFGEIQLLHKKKIDEGY